MGDIDHTQSLSIAELQKSASPMPTSIISPRRLLLLTARTTPAPVLFQGMSHYDEPGFEGGRIIPDSKRVF